MPKGQILFGLIDDEDSYKVIEVIKKLNELGYEAKLLKTNTSENFVPIYYLDNIFFEEDQLFDIGVIGPFDEKNYNNIDINDLREDTNIDSLKVKISSYLKEKNNGLMLFEDFSNIDLLVKKIDLSFKNNSLRNYSFLFTIGHFKEHLTNNHYIGVYNRKGFIESIIEYIIKAGGNVSVVASKNYKGKLDYIEDVVYVNDIKEINMVLDSKIFKYDIVIDGIRIPRFSLRDDEKFKIEYQRYFAEFEEKYLPFTNEDIYSNNQIIASIINGFIDNKEAIYYLFDNTGIDVVLLNEFSLGEEEFKPYLKLINKDKSVDMISFKDNKLFVRELVDLLIKKLEE